MDNLQDTPLCLPFLFYRVANNINIVPIKKVAAAAAQEEK